MGSPHDALFKASFGQPEIARSEFDLVLPPAVRAHLDLATLALCPGSFVDEDLQHTHSDLLYAVRLRAGGEGLVYILFEHQSSPDATMPFRLLRYMVRVWERWLRDHPGTKTLPIVLPVLLHHGDGAWKAAPELASVFDATPEVLDAFRVYVPHFRFVLDDLVALTPAALCARDLAALPRLVQLALWASRSFPRLREAVPFMRAVAATLVRDDNARALLAQVYRYVFSTAPPDVDVAKIRTMLLEVAGPEGAEDVMNAAEQLIAEGEKRGEKRGELKGELRGEQKGLRVAIATALGARAVSLSEFGSARIASCSDVETLTRWLTRAVTASSEAEVFASDSAP
jgi:predicted transposase/invertase (TIGR01784 family)